MPYKTHGYRDLRTGRFRKPLPYERNQFYSIDTLSRGLANFSFKTANELGDYGAEFANELVEYARDHAPWTDRTGDARAGLQSEAFLYNQALEIELYHTVSYGIWLEVRWGAKYAIIIPTVEEMGPRLFDKMTNMLEEIIYYD